MGGRGGWDAPTRGLHITQYRQRTRSLIEIQAFLFKQCSSVSARILESPIACTGTPRSTVPVKRHRGEPGHTRDTQALKRTRGHTVTRRGRTQTNLTSIQTQRHTRTTMRQPKPETAADSTAARTAAGPESTTPRGRLRRGPGMSTASWEVTGVLYRGGVIKLPRTRFLPAAGAKFLAILTVNHYI